MGQLQVISRLTELKPIEGIGKVMLHYDIEKGWIVEFWYKSDNAFSEYARYTIWKNKTVYGIFSSIIAVQKAKTGGSYLFPAHYTEQQVIDEVSTWTLEYYLERIEESREQLIKL